MTEGPTLSKEQTDDINLVLEVMAAAPVPLGVHNAGRAALARLGQALLPQPAEAPPEPPAARPELVV